MSLINYIKFTLLFILVGCLIWLVVSIVSPPANFDFQILYYTDASFLNGIQIYDHAAQTTMIADRANTNANSVFILPFPYPPWYVYFTFFLAYFPIAIAAKIWFGINILILLIGLWLLTNDLILKQRILFTIAVLIFFPIVGGLYVGQYNFPVFLGIALLIYSSQKKLVIPTAISFALLSLKPHIGMPVAAVFFIQILFQTIQGISYYRHALFAVLGVTGLLFFSGYISGADWPANYLNSLIGYQDVSGVSECGICISLSSFVNRRFLQGEASSYLLSAIIACGIIAVGSFRIKNLVYSEENLIIFSIFLVLLASPYLLNYDLILLVIPLYKIIHSDQRAKWLTAASSYFSIQLSILFLRREATPILLLSILVVFIFLFFPISQITQPHPASVPEK